MQTLIHVDFSCSFAQNMVGQVTYTTGMIFHHPPYWKFLIDGPFLIYLYFQPV